MNNIIKLLHSNPDADVSAGKLLLQKISQRLKAILPFANNTTPKRGTITTDATTGIKTYTFADLEVEYVLSNEKIAADTAEVARFKTEATANKTAAEAVITELQAYIQKQNTILNACTSAETKLAATVTAIGKL